MKEGAVALRHEAIITMERVGGRHLRVARWHWDEPGEHLPILFFNGIGANIEAVAPLAEALAERPFITFDMPGAGGSPDPLVPYNFFTMALLAKTLLRRFGCGRVDVMGVSWGGALAQHFALQHPRSVRLLVLAATGAGMVMFPGKPGALAKLIRPRRADAGGNGEYLSRLRPPSSRGFLYQMMAMAGWTSAPALPFLRKRTLILMGSADKIVPPVNGRILKTLIPGSRLEMLDGGGHLFILSHMEETVIVLRDFLAVPGQAD